MAAECNMVMYPKCCANVLFSVSCNVRRERPGSSAQLRAEQFDFRSDQALWLAF